MVEHDQLDKCPGFLRILPLRCPLAGAQADDRTTDADAFPRLQGDVPHQTVALVEQAEHRHPILHSGDTGIGIILSGGRLCLWNRAIVGGRGRRGFPLTVASGQRQGHPRDQHRQRMSGGGDGHVASGVHA